MTLTMSLFKDTLASPHSLLHWLLRTVRGRFAIISLVSLLLLLGLSVYTWSLVSSSSRDVSSTLNNYYTIESQVLQPLSVEVNQLEVALYQHVVMLDSKLEVQLAREMQTLLVRAGELKTMVERNGLDELRSDAAQLETRMQELAARLQHVHELLSSAESRYPAIETTFSEMHPNHLEIVSALGAALREVEEGTGSEAFHRHVLWQRLGHAWMQLAFEARTLIANRSGVFGEPDTTLQASHENHLMWRDRVESLLTALESEKNGGELGFQQSEALERIRHSIDEFERGYHTVYEILTSSQWRADLPYLNQFVRPAFAQVRQNVLTLRQLVSAKMTSSLTQSQQLSDRLVLFLWGLVATAIILVFIAYTSFTRFIYRPLKDVATALEDAGRGEHYSLLRSSKIDEINMLVKAYTGMQAQVHSRQVRLQSILENISDGIITIDEQGRIETFNSAAQHLFGYSFEEVYGQSVTLLMPEPMRNIHPGYIDNYRKHGIRHAIDREREETARRKDGSLFPMSIKVKEMLLEDQRYFTAVVADISERKAAMERLREMAEKDALTGLHNRRYFLDELERAVDRAIRGGSKVTLLYIDLDNFKFVNDTMGHQAGDQVLIEVTEMLGVRVRSGDLFARLGGDEFAVLLYELDDDKAMKVAESYRRLLTDYIFKYDGRVVDIGCSIGVAAFTDGINNKEDLLARADLACHIAKSNGRNRTHLFDASSQEEVEGMSADMGWAHRIKQAIEGDGFALAYQPIVSSTSGEPYSYEVLLRMVGDDDELIYPAGFLPAAERFGLMVDIDRWVIRHAVKALQTLQQKGEAINLNINLAAPSVETPDILETVREVLQQTGVDARSLIFEITETTAITKLAQAVDLLDGLKNLGCGTALDDFGTGYSSFAYLKELPVDYVKIDGSFVQNLDRDRLNQVMVRSMHDVAHAMGKRSVAEFVESAEVMQALREIGVDYQQGYYLGKPELNIPL